MEKSKFEFKVNDDDFVVSQNCRPWTKCVSVANLPEGVAVRDTKDPKGGTLFFTHEEWDTFKDGVKNDEF